MSEEEGTVFRIGFTVLDRQVVDRDGVNLGKVDDVEFTRPEGQGGEPNMTALIIDTAAIGGRISGRFGRYWEAVVERLRPQKEGSIAIPVEHVEEFAPTTVLSTRAPEGMHPLEKWVARHVIGRIPGARK